MARPGQGRSGGYRTLILSRSGNRAVFAFGFAKNRQANITPADAALLKKAATLTLALSEANIDVLVEAGELTEVTSDGE